ncbi:MAG: hypothetical protein KC621_03170 [Myxococcales bacterium]|nr:hypothetical protein [Myxococcales bacterium]
MMSMWMVLAACHAQAGELWLRIEETQADGNRFELVLPATSLRERTEPVTLHTGHGDVDLVAEARSLRVGKERRWTDHDGATVVLEHDEPAGSELAKEVQLQITGKNGGMGMTLNFPLEREQMDPMDQNAKRVDVTIDGMELGYDEAGCAQLRRSPGRVLFRLVGPKDHGIVAASR